MQSYAAFEFAKDLNILVGIENNKILFSHSFTSEDEKAHCLRMERRYFPNLRESSLQLQPIFKKLAGYCQGDDIDPANFILAFPALNSLASPSSLGV